MHRDITLILATSLLALSAPLAAGTFQQGDVTTLLGPKFFIDEATNGGVDTDLHQDGSNKAAFLLRSFNGLLTPNQGPSRVVLTGFGFALHTSATANDAGRDLQARIDEAKALEAKKLAEEAMKNAKTDIDFAKAAEDYFYVRDPAEKSKLRQKIEALIGKKIQQRESSVANKREELKRAQGKIAATEDGARRQAEASGVRPRRSSIRFINPACDRPPAAATASSTAQNSASSATEVA
jgi:hypothetical protein